MWTDAGSPKEAKMDSSGCRTQRSSLPANKTAAKSYALRGCVLLEWRLTSLGLNPKGIKRVSPEILERLRSTCTACSHKQRCFDDMMNGFNTPGWEQYCPNAETLSSLSASNEPDISIK
jgi:hypothetical protein